MRVSDLMECASLPLLPLDTPVTDALQEMTAHRGICLAVDQRNRLMGVFVYGDLGRLMKTAPDLRGLSLSEVMTGNPAVCSPDDLVALAVQRMEEMGITSIVAVDDKGIPMGILYLHDALTLGF